MMSVSDGLCCAAGSTQQREQAAVTGGSSVGLVTACSHCLQTVFCAGSCKMKQVLANACAGNQQQILPSLCRYKS